MRMSSEEKLKSRARILSAAARRFREQGIAAVGLAEVMQDAGLTHGGFYRHFPDKAGLVRAALADAFAGFAGPLARATPAEFFSRYLSRGHRDAAGQGCPVAALGPEVARSDAATRATMTEGVEAMLAALSQGQTAPDRAAALHSLSTLIGAIVLARAVSPALSDEVLATARAALGLPPEEPAQPSR